MIQKVFNKIFKSENTDYSHYPDFTKEDWEIINFVRPYTMTEQSNENRRTRRERVRTSNWDINIS